VAQQFVELQGAERLVRLCKDEKERNHSDGVLVACLVSIYFFLLMNRKFSLDDF
jgi:Protein inscuteable C-terminal